MSDLTTKQRLFVEAYLASPNATEAAKAAGYSEKTAYSQGQRLLKKVEIQDAISERVAGAAMSANEVLWRLSQHARASLADLLDDDGQFDLEQAKADGKDHLLKKLKIRKIVSEKGDYETTTYEYEVHDPQAALVHLGKFHKLFTDKTEFSGEIGLRLVDDAE